MKLTHANSKILAQHDGNASTTPPADIYFYLHDRLGSVRNIINSSGNVVMLYTYNPFGETLESDGSFVNPWRFTGQYFDSEIDEYYLRARMYDPYIYRFTSRDPVLGKFENPLTLHAYLYCLNDPINKIDPSGEFLSTFISLVIRSSKNAKDAAASIAAKIWAERKLKTTVTFANAFYRGVYNEWFGPEELSDNAKFWIGFIGGGLQMELAWWSKGGPGRAAAAGDAFIGTFNEILSQRTMRLGKAARIATDAAISSWLGFAGGQMVGKEALQMQLVQGVIPPIKDQIMLFFEWFDAFATEPVAPDGFWD